MTHTTDEFNFSSSSLPLIKHSWETRYFCQCATCVFLFWRDLRYIKTFAKGEPPEFHLNHFNLNRGHRWSLENQIYPYYHYHCYSNLHSIHYLNWTPEISWKMTGCSKLSARLSFKKKVQIRIHSNKLSSLSYRSKKHYDTAARIQMKKTTRLQNSWICCS